MEEVNLLDQNMVAVFIEEVDNQVMSDVNRRLKQLLISKDKLDMLDCLKSSIDELYKETKNEWIKLKKGSK